MKSPLVKRLVVLLQCSQPEQNSMRSESAFILMKLACSGGEPCIKKFLKYDIILELVKMMQCSVTELQDSDYTALHQILSSGEVLILSRILQMGLIEKLVHSMDSKSVKTREVSVHFILDIVEVGNRTTLERMLSLQLVEKLVRMEILVKPWLGLFRSRKPQKDQSFILLLPLAIYLFQAVTFLATCHFLH